MRKCTKCGRKWEDDKRMFCGECGMKLPAQQEANGGAVSIRDLNTIADGVCRSIEVILSILKQAKSLENIPDDYQGEYIVPNCVKSIADRAFFGKKQLRSVIIPDSVKSIGIFAFCSQLRKVRLPEGIKYIPVNAFLGCIALEELNIPDTVTEIDSFAFSYCISLKKLVLGSQLTDIQEYAFAYSTLTSERVCNLNKVANCDDKAFWKVRDTAYSGKFKIELGGENNIRCKSYYAVDSDIYNLITDDFGDEEIPAAFVSMYYD